MLEKHIPIERLKPDYPCPACKKSFDDCECDEDTADEGFNQVVASGCVTIVGFVLFAVLMWFWLMGKLL